MLHFPTAGIDLAHDMVELFQHFVEADLQHADFIVRAYLHFPGQIALHNGLERVAQNLDRSDEQAGDHADEKELERKFKTRLPERIENVGAVAGLELTDDLGADAVSPGNLDHFSKFVRGQDTVIYSRDHRHQEEAKLELPADT